MLEHKKIGEIMISDFGKNFIGKCKVCKKVIRISRELLFTALSEHNARKYWNGSSFKYLLKCECSNSDFFIALKAIEGFKNETPCNAKCTGAVGHVCECSCGGANHSVSHCH